LFPAFQVNRNLVRRGNQGVRQVGACRATPGDSEVEELKKLLQTLDQYTRDLPVSVQRSLIGVKGLRRLAVAMTILLTDYGGTTPWATCEAMAQAAPKLYKQSTGSTRSTSVDVCLTTRSWWSTTFGIGRTSDAGTHRAFRRQPMLRASSISRRAVSLSDTSRFTQAA
jgi:hypothetical protein